MIDPASPLAALLSWPLLQVLLMLAVVWACAKALDTVDVAHLPAWLQPTVARYQQLLRYTSMQAAQRWMLVTATWSALPEDIRSTLLAGVLPPSLVTWLLAVAAFARVMRERGTLQPELRGQDPTVPPTLPGAPGER